MEEKKDMTVRLVEEESKAVIHRETGEFSVVQVKAQVDKVQELMRSLMKDGEHYGKVPGTDKPTLLQPGAQKIALMFRAIPKYTRETRDLPGAHREYIIACDLHHADGSWLGQGFGSCSTMESKYRWREDSRKIDVGDVPKAYWNAPRDDMAAKQATLVAAFGPGKYRAKKVSGEWRVLRVEGTGDRVENPDIADMYNTVLKMAVKRALVAAVLCAFAVSDIFTQDLEDTMDVEFEEATKGNGKPPTEVPKAAAPGTVPKSTKPLSERIKAVNTSPLLTPEEHAEISKTIPKTSADDLHAYLAGWEKDIQERANPKSESDGKGAGVPDADIPFGDG